MKHWTSDSMNQWTDIAVNGWLSETMVQWISESMEQWLCESNETMKRRSNESMNQCSNESIYQWFNEPMSQKQWTHEYQRINEWTHEWMAGWLDGWINGCMDGWVSELLLLWVTSSLSDFFTERLLYWGTPFLSYFFSGLPLIWATSSLPDPALSCFPATSSVASPTQCFSSSSCYNAFSSFQLQFRIAQEYHCGQELPFAQLLQLAISSRIPAYHERRDITDAFCCAQPCQCVPGPLRVQLFKHFFVKSSSRYSLVHGLPTSSSKSASRISAFNVWNSNRALSIYSPVHFLSTALPDQSTPSTAETETYFGHPRSHITQKNRVLRPRVFSPVNSQVPELLLLSTAPTPELLLLTMWMTWWPNCPWTFVRNSEVFELNFLW